ncbi:hypothetical protein GCM10009629_41050 [Pseudonocardia alni]
MVMLICGLHLLMPVHGPELVAGGSSTQLTGSQASAGVAADQSADHRDQIGAERPAAPHSHPDAPVCHQDGAHDESTLTARADRPVPPDVCAGAGVEIRVAAAMRAPPQMHRAVKTTPARAEGGRHHLVLAQISRT